MLVVWKLVKTRTATRSCRTGNAHFIFIRQVSSDRYGHRPVAAAAASAASLLLLLPPPLLVLQGIGSLMIKN